MDRVGTHSDPLTSLSLAVTPQSRAAEHDLPHPDFGARLFLQFQRTTGQLLFLPFGGLLVVIMYFLAKYRVQNRSALRRQFNEIVRDPQPLILCGNHLTFIDSVILLWALGRNSRYFLNFRRFSWNLPAGDFFKKKFIFRVIAFLSKCIFIHRDGTKDHKSEILGICNYLLGRNELVTIFPEGRRSRTGVFNREGLTFGVGKLLAANPGCRVLCFYLRGDKQRTISNYPAKGSKFEIHTELFTPSTTAKGKAAYLDLVGQVGERIAQLEEKYFADKGGRPAPQKGFGRVALVTGASEGIGRALADQLAAGRYDLVLVGRNRARLSSLAQELESKYGCLATVSPGDLSRPEEVDRLCREWDLANLRPEILVNNAGFGVHGSFSSTSLEAELRMVELQIGSLLRLTKWAVGSMIPARQGRILNVASVYAFTPVPQQSVYAASKAFLRSFSDSLSAELADKNITVSLLCPGVTQTEFRKRAGIHEKENPSGMSAKKVARIAYQGLMAGDRVIVPGAVNRLFLAALRLIPNGRMVDLMTLINRRRGVDNV